MDFILLVCAGGRQLLGRAAVDRRQLTGKMKSTALAIGMSGTASPRRTIVLSLAKANSVILESPERDVKRPFRPKSSTVALGKLERQRAPPSATLLPTASSPMAHVTWT